MTLKRELEELKEAEAALASTNKELENVKNELASVRAQNVSLQSKLDVAEAALLQANKREQDASVNASQSRTAKADAEKDRARAIAEAEKARKDAEKAYEVAAHVERERYQDTLRDVYKTVGELLS